MAADRPFISSYRDRHDKTRWRFRRNGKATALPHEPGHPQFEAAYAALLAGKPVEKAAVRRLPTAAVPRSLRAAWRVVTTETIDWKSLRPDTRLAQTKIAERFLSTPVVDGEPLLFGDLAIADLKRRHVQAVLARWSDTPHAAAHILRLIRKFTGAALDQEWIEVDPTYRVSFRPPFKGWRGWAADERAAYEARWPIGTTPRLVYALALYTGSRRGDVATMKWADISNGGIRVVQRKTGKALWLPIMPELAAVLAVTPKRGETILVTAYGEPFSIKALGMRMQHWTAAAGLKGTTLHGLRKTMGKLLAEGGATTRQLMGVLGHDSIAHAELYTREAEQKRLATDGMKRLAKKPRLAVVNAKKPRGEPSGEP